MRRIVMFISLFTAPLAAPALAANEAVVLVDHAREVSLGPGRLAAAFSELGDQGLRYGGAVDAWVRFERVADGRRYAYRLVDTRSRALDVLLAEGWAYRGRLEGSYVLERALDPAPRPARA